MKISYNLESEDLLVFYKRGLRKNSFIFKNTIFIVGVFIALLLSYYDRYSNSSLASGLTQFATYTSNFWFDSAINLVAITISIFLVRIITISYFRFLLRKKTAFQGNRELEILNERIIFSSQNSKTDYLFTVIQIIEDYQDHYFIYTSKESAVIVPKKAIGSDDFIKQLSEKINLKVIVC